ncbi:methylated-DNA-[protein]-cysteine S-methyltransferase [Gracilibacillus ureilyticus]|uniref:Methylated-DNA--protein-cysteine methyltransferase n=1 Tax=Gracilibacillus ureilyticus TaxID=531814 RepID=A0A1H9PK63_9BACI|nr:methylated-DNA--[protein]-cysteine S-methyltransferase [Gracilibacillus ureilyticus]SER48229.1 methylated-DNA-[protein]-cysteine S-methyltransferase [Gracilibacillus ureilyticus]
MNELFYTEMDSPIGKLTLVGSEDTIFSLNYGSYTANKEYLLKWCIQHQFSPVIHYDRNILKEVQIQLTEYFQGLRSQFSIKYKLFGTEFQKKVWNALTQVPYGETYSYKQIAETIGSPKAVRAVGGANNKNPLSIVIPCHRVIGIDGKLVGYGGGLEKKTYLLDLEKGKGQV